MLLLLLLLGADCLNFASDTARCILRYACIHTNTYTIPYLQHTQLQIPFFQLSVSSACSLSYFFPPLSPLLPCSPHTNSYFDSIHSILNSPAHFRLGSYPNLCRPIHARQCTSQTLLTISLAAPPPPPPSLPTCRTLPFPCNNCTPKFLPFGLNFALPIHPPCRLPTTTTNTTNHALFSVSGPEKKPPPNSTTSPLPRYPLETYTTVTQRRMRPHGPFRTLCGSALTFASSA